MIEGDRMADENRRRAVKYGLLGDPTAEGFRLRPDLAEQRREIVRQWGR